MSPIDWDRINAGDHQYFKEHKKEITAELVERNRLAVELSKRTAEPPPAKPRRWFGADGKEMPSESVPEPKVLYHAGVKIKVGTPPETWEQVTSPIPPMDSDVLDVWLVVAPLLPNNVQLLKWVERSGLHGAAMKALAERKEADLRAGFERAALHQREQWERERREAQAKADAVREAQAKAAEARHKSTWPS